MNQQPLLSAHNSLEPRALQGTQRLVRVSSEVVGSQSESFRWFQWGLKQRFGECINRGRDFLAGEWESEISRAARKERGWKILPQNQTHARAPTEVTHQWQNLSLETGRLLLVALPKKHQHSLYSWRQGGMDRQKVQPWALSFSHWGYRDSGRGEKNERDRMGALNLSEVWKNGREVAVNEVKFCQATEGKGC